MGKPDIAPYLVAAVLAAGAWLAVRSAAPPGGYPKHRRPKPRPRTEEPAPVAGGAAGLLEHIPYLEPVSDRRMSSSLKLLVMISIAAAIVAATLYALGRSLTTWIDSLKIL